MATIHHNTVKRAARMGATLTANGSGFVAETADGASAEGANAKVALDHLEQVLKALEDGESEAEGDDEAELEEVEEVEEVEDEESDEDGASVVKRKYRTRYKPFKHTCGDGLTTQLAKFLKVKDDDGEERIDGAKLKRFAQLNGVWKPAYAHLNVGMQRMNVANRLRKLVRDGEKIKWGA